MKSRFLSDTHDESFAHTQVFISSWLSRCVPRIISCVFLALVLCGCQSVYHVTVSGHEEQPTLALQVQNALDIYLTSHGFHQCQMPASWIEAQGDAHVAMWQKEEKPSFWWGTRGVSIEERKERKEVIVYVNGSTGLMQNAAEEVRKNLQETLPGYTVRLGNHTMYGPSWVRN